MRFEIYVMQINDRMSSTYSDPNHHHDLVRDRTTAGEKNCKMYNGVGYVRIPLFLSQKSELGHLGIQIQSLREN